VTEHYAVGVFAEVLYREKGWWRHVAVVREGARPVDLSREYVTRGGRRHRVVAEFLRRAAMAPTTGDAMIDRLHGRDYMVNISRHFVWEDDAPLKPGERRRAGRRPDWARTILVGAVRVARRGAGRCMEPECLLDRANELWTGVQFRKGNSGYCKRCKGRTRRPSETTEAERALFDALAPLVLRHEWSRPAARRAQRSGAR
jgi:hypothetical protein